MVFGCACGVFVVDVYACDVVIIVGVVECYVDIVGYVCVITNGFGVVVAVGMHWRLW